MPSRKLSLSRERLQELRTDELAGLAGGAPPTWDCETVGFTCTIGYTRNLCEPVTTLQLACWS